MGDRDNIPLDELFAAAGIDAAQGRTAVESAIDHGYFGADAYIDNRTDTLVVRAQHPSRPEPEACARPRPAAEDQYAALQRQLREVNDAIPDPVMTRRSAGWKRSAPASLSWQSRTPDKKAQLQKFMDYYLPTALKLLNTYASLSCAGCAGHEHHRCQAEHRAQHGPAGDRL